MKENLFEMLLHLFEKTLAQLKESHVEEKSNEAVEQPKEQPKALSWSGVGYGLKAPTPEQFKVANTQSMRVFTADEQMKLTKTSYQFLMRLLAWGVITSDSLEIIMNQLILSDSLFVGLHETKWVIHNTLAEHLSAQELAFLDAVLYQQEDGLSLH